MLTLPIKRKWFDMIVSGEKKEEYRDATLYYIKRFHFMGACGPLNLEGIRKEGYKIILRAGYRKDSPKCLISCWIDYGHGKAEWGAAPGVKYFRLHITDVQEVKENAEHGH